jgi:DNA modification methylase
VLGFDDDELAEILGPNSAGLTDPDLIPEPPSEPISKPGDLWILGNHRLLCGDSTVAEDVTRLMDGERAPLMATDPPYLVGYDGGDHPPTLGNKGKLGKPYEKHWDTYIDHEHSVEFYTDFLRTAVDCALTEDAAIYQFFAIMRSDVLFEAWEAAGLLMHQVLIWKKTRAVLTHSAYMWDYEPFCYGWQQGHMPSRPPADAKAVWEVASGGDDASGVHPTQKVVELIRRPILYHTKPGDLLYEPFSGSGTALIAAEASGRRCYAIELAPSFVDVAITRWQNFTGKKAVCDGQSNQG